MVTGALLLIWTIVSTASNGGAGSDAIAISQTTTPLASMEICRAAKESIQNLTIPRAPSRDRVGTILKVECVPTK